MEQVGEAWLMTSLTTSPILVALLQSTDSLPVFLLALPAGALADIVDRRRMLIFSQAWMLTAAVLLGVLTVLGLTTPLSLLVLTFAMGIGGAMNAPAWQALIPELVSRAELPAALALGSVAFNLSRSIGPALGGFVVAAVGPGVTFLLNGLSFLGVLIVLFRWRRAPRKSVLPTERLVGAMKAGARYVRHAPGLRAVLMRTAAFMIGASAVWALLPLLARHQLKLTSVGYGVMLGCLGVGAVLGATVLPRIRRKISIDRLVIVATILFASTSLTLALVNNLGVVFVAMAVGGAAWMTVMSSLTLAAQTAVPEWVRARAMAIFLLVFQGGMAAGSVLWGAVAARAGLMVALEIAAAILIAGLAMSVRWGLRTAEGIDLTPSPISEPVVALTPEAEGGPVMIQVEYRIDPVRADDFVASMQSVKRFRRRDGAMRWALFNDAADPARYLETYLVESWAEHLRQHARMTGDDRENQDRARVFHLGDEPPRVTHSIGVRQPSS
jgi:MFS family permease